MTPVVSDVPPENEWAVEVYKPYPDGKPCWYWTPCANVAEAAKLAIRDHRSRVRRQIESGWSTVEPLDLVGVLLQEHNL